MRLIHLLLFSLITFSACFGNPTVARNNEGALHHHVRRASSGEPINLGLRLHKMIIWLMGAKIRGVPIVSSDERVRFKNILQLMTGYEPFKNSREFYDRLTVRQRAKPKWLIREGAAIEADVTSRYRIYLSQLREHLDNTIGLDKVQMAIVDGLRSDEEARREGQWKIMSMQNEFDQALRSCMKYKTGWFDSNPTPEYIVAAKIRDRKLNDLQDYVQSLIHSSVVWRRHEISHIALKPVDSTEEASLVNEYTSAWFWGFTLASTKTHGLKDWTVMHRRRGVEYRWWGDLEREAEYLENIRRKIKLGEFEWLQWHLDCEVQHSGRGEQEACKIF